MNINKTENKKIILAALFSGIICILAQISVLTPSGIPVTLQILGVALAGFTLGAKWSAASVAVYLVMGFVGLPVFSQFRGGVQMLFSYTGGFLIGFLPLAVCCGIAKTVKNKPLKVSFTAFGIALCHTAGVLHLILVSKAGFKEAVIGGSLPFLLKDVILVLLAFGFYKALEKRLKV